MKKFIALSLSLVFSLVAQAQKIKWETGSLDVLKGVENVATEVRFENLMVSEMSEEAFVKERKERFNSEKAGEGDKFEADWQFAKTSKWNTRFAEHLTKASKEKVKASPENASAPYKIILTPNNIDVGKGRYIGTKPALVDFDIIIIGADNPEKILAKGTAKEVKGEAKAPKGSNWIPGGAGTAIDLANRVQNFDLTNRIAESFELLSVSIGKSLR